MIDTLALFFTRGVSLQEWLRRGMFDREKLLYEEHLRQGHVRRVIWLTYGTGDAAIAARLHAEGRLHPSVHVVDMPRPFASKAGGIAYSLVAPLLRGKQLRAATVIKTNQMDGAWAALLAGALHGKPVLVRTGFTLSLFEAYEHGDRAARVRLARWVERIAYRFGDMAAVSSRRDMEYLAGAYSAPDIRLLPNYVDTDLFHPGDTPRTPERMVFVGRLHPQKNLAALIPVLREAGCGLDIYGSGQEEAALRQLAAHCGADVRFHGSIANDRLPDVLRLAETFILPSTFEGMPKALLEAMACGCVCVGADVPGVNEVILNGVNGLLAPAPTGEGFRAVLRRLAQADKPALSQAGVAHIRARYSLSAVAHAEAAMLEELASRSKGGARH